MPDKPKQPTPPPGEDASSASEQLLGEIRNRFEQLETIAALPKKKLKKLEQQHASQLRDIEKRLEKYVKASQEHKKQIDKHAQKNRELTAAVESLTKQRDDAATALAEHRRLLRQRQKQLQILNQQLAETQSQLSEQDKQIAGLKQSLGEAHTSAQAPSADADKADAAELSPDSGSRSDSSKRLTILIGVIALVTLAVWLTALVYVRSGKTLYRLTGVVLGPPGDSKMLDDCQVATSYDDVRTEVDQEAGLLLRLVVETTDPMAGKGKIDALAGAMVSAMQSEMESPSTSWPVNLTQRDKLAKHLGEIERRLAEITTQPAADSGKERTRLLASWKNAQAQREKILASVVKLSARIASKPLDKTLIQLDPDRLRSAKATDQRLQADTKALQRKRQLIDMLRIALQNGQDRFDKLASAVADSDMHLAKELKADHSNDVDEQLRVMRKSLTQAAKAASNLAKTWREKQVTLSAADSAVDPAACQADLERAARAFVDTKAATMVRFAKALESIGQGGDQPTKRLVLHNVLTRQQKEALEELEKVQSAARSVMLAHNVPLAAMVQNVTGLLSQVRDRRLRIENALRQQILAQVQSKHDREVADARAERDRLGQRMSQLDKDIIKFATEALELIAKSDTESADLAEQASLNRLRAETLAKIVRIDESALSEHAGVTKPIAIRYIPPVATAEPITPAGRRLAIAVLVGGAPLLVCVLVGAIIWGVQSWLRSRRSITQYTRALQDAFTTEQQPTDVER